MLNVALMLLMFYLMWGIIGVEVIGGSLGNHCRLNESHFNESHSLNETAGESPIVEAPFAEPVAFGGAPVVVGEPVEVLNETALNETVSELLEAIEWEKHPVQELPFDGWTFCKVGNDSGPSWVGGRTCPSGYVCEPTKYYPNYNSTRFDNFGVAVISLFQTISMENWVFISYWSMDATNDFTVIFFIIVRLFGFFMVLGLFLASVRGAWRRQKELRKHIRNMKGVKQEEAAAAAAAAGLEPDREAPTFVNRIADWLRRPPEESIANQYGCAAAFYRLGYKIQHRVLDSLWFQRTVIGAVIINGIILCMDAFGAPEAYSKALNGINLAFTMIFTLEAVLRLMGLGLYLYFKSPLNWIDLLVVITGWVEAVISDSQSLTGLRVVRILRLFKALRAWPRLRRLLDALSGVASLMFWSLCLLLLIIFIYALVGMHIFGGKFHFEGLEHQPRFHFDNLYWAIVSVFMVLGVFDWNEILFSAIRSVGYASIVYFFTLIVLASYLVVNLFVSVIITAITEAAKLDHEAQEKHHDAHRTHEKQEESEEQVEMASHDIVKLAAAGKIEVPKSHGHVEDMDEDWKRSLKYSSFCCLSGTNKLRVSLGKLLTSTPVRVIFAIVIITSCVTLAIEVTDDPPSKSVFGPSPIFRDVFIFWLDVVFLVVFGLEVIAGMLVHGFAFHPFAYLRNPWNWVDMITFVGMLVDYAAVHTIDLTYLRALRSLRAIKMIAKFKFTRVVFHTLGKALPFLPAIVPICIFVWLIFSILGLQLFGGLMWHCNDGEVVDKLECVGYFEQHLENETLILAERKWINYDNSWDNIGESFFNVFKMASFEGTLDTMLRTVDAVGIDKNPRRDYNPAAALFYITFIPFSTWIVLGLTVGTIVDTFAEIRREEGEHAQVGMTDEQRQWVEMQKLLINTLPGIKAPPPKQRWRRKLYNIVKHQAFEIVLAVVIVLNIAILCINHNGQSDQLQLLQTVSDYLFTAIYIIEAVIKLVAVSPKWYFRDGWNILDMIIVVASIISWIIAGVLSTNPILGGIVKALRVLRVLRVVKLFKGAKEFRLLFKTVVLSLPAMLNVFLVCFLVMYAFAIVGVALFKDVREGFAISERANFQTFGSALFLLFRMATGERWDLIMYDVAHATTKWSYIYFVLFVIIVTHVLVNAAIAIVIDNFSYATNTLAERDVTMSHFTNFLTTWHLFDKAGRGTLPISMFQSFLQKLPPPLGVGSNTSEAYLKLFMTQTLAAVPISGGEVFFPHVLLNLTRRAMGLESVPQIQYDKMLAKWQQFYTPAEGGAAGAIGASMTIDEIMGIIAIQRRIRSHLMWKRLHEVTGRTHPLTREEKQHRKEELRQSNKKKRRESRV